MTNGPVVAEIIAYQDFKKYKGKDVYKYVAGGNIGGHAIKIIGWGVERGVPFWTILNSWGKSWLDFLLFAKLFKRSKFLNDI